MMAREKKPMRLKLDHRELDADDVLKMCTSKHSYATKALAIGTWGDDELLPNDFEYDAEWHDEDMSRLADLIDRPTCFNTESKDSNSFTCSACGFSESKLVIQPFSLDFCYVKPNYHYCPNCGKEIASNNK